MFARGSCVACARHVRNLFSSTRRIGGDIKLISVFRWCPRSCCRRLWHGLEDVRPDVTSTTAFNLSENAAGGRTEAARPHCGSRHPAIFSTTGWPNVRVCLLTLDLLLYLQFRLLLCLLPRPLGALTFPFVCAQMLLSILEQTTE